MSGAAPAKRKGPRAVQPRSDNSRNTRGQVQLMQPLSHGLLVGRQIRPGHVGLGVTQHDADIPLQMPVSRAFPRRPRASHVGRIIDSEIGSMCSRYCWQSADAASVSPWFLAPADQITEREPDRAGNQHRGQGFLRGILADVLS